MEYEDIELNELKKLLGGVPTATLCIEMRGLKTKQYIEDTKEFVIKILTQFEGIVDDQCFESKFWSLSEILDNKDDFLNCYRYKDKVLSMII